MKKNLLSACAVVLAAATMLTFFSPIAKAQAVSSAYRQFADQACEANSFSLYDDYAPSAIVPDYPTPGGGFYAPNGGTLYLTYTGSRDWVYTKYTRIVYLSRNITQDIMKLYTCPTPVDDLIDFLREYGTEAGLGVLTDAFVVRLAIKMGMAAGAASALGALVGFSISLLIFMLSNFTRWDFTTAINQSSTGKLKLEFFAMYSVFPPFYQSIRSFSPWNSDFVTVPADHAYTWANNVYDHGLNT